jgi:hypothetical protein
MDCNNLASSFVASDALDNNISYQRLERYYSRTVTCLRLGHHLETKSSPFIVQ